MVDLTRSPTRVQVQPISPAASSSAETSTHSPEDGLPDDRKLGLETHSDPNSSIPQNQDVEYVVERIRAILQYDKAHISTERHGLNPTATPTSSLEWAIGLFQRVVAHFVQFLYRAINFRNVVVPNPTSITHPSLEHADDHALRELCSKLLEYAGSGTTSARIAAMKEIIALIVNVSTARETLRSCQGLHGHRATTTSTDQEIDTWNSRTFFAIEDTRVHDLWFEVILEPAIIDDLQIRSDDRVAENDGKLWELAQTLKDPQSSYLASRYLNRAKKLASEASKLRRTSTNTPESNAQRFSRTSNQSAGSSVEHETHHSENLSPATPKSPEQTGSFGDEVIPQELQAKPKSSKELLKYVLKSAPEGSLKDLTDVVRLDAKNDRIVGRGGFSDVYHGSMPVSGNDIAIKLFRLHVEGTDGVKNFAKELRVTSRLKHPNVLTPLGYVSREGGGSEEYYIVSEFMPRGSLRFCMAELSMRERYSISLGIAEGIRYLHDNDVVHGDIKTDNVLLSPSGVPLLSDFGVSRVKESFVSKGYYSTATPRASMRWLAYEYFNHPDAEEFHFTKKTDVWAFGMTLLELLTGELPYAHIRSDSRVVTEIVMGRLPHKPTIENNDVDAELKRFLWSICLKCWNKKPDVRPPIDVVLQEMAFERVSRA